MDLDGCQVRLIPVCNTTIAKSSPLTNGQASASCRETCPSRDKPAAVLWWTRSFRREDTNGKGRPRSRTFVTKTHVQELKHKFDEDTEPPWHFFIITSIQLKEDSSPSPPYDTMAHNDPIADAKAQEATHKYAFRPATLEDIPALQQMIGDSLRALGKGYYTDAELDGSIGFLFGPDTVLIHDQ